MCCGHYEFTAQNKKFFLGGGGLGFKQRILRCTKQILSYLQIGKYYVTAKDTPTSTTANLI